MTLLKLLRKGFNKIRFTTPTHGQKNLFMPELREYIKLDYSENVGFDNLQNPTGAILMAQGKASDIYGTQKTFFLVNGSTSGILATMLAVLSDKDKILVARNCHKAVYNGAVLTGSEVDWILPEIDKEWGIYTEINLKKLEDALKINSYKMFIMTSPTYDGINSNIEEISKLCKQYGVYLFVDEAHGALYNFSDIFPKTAIQQGADFSVNSLHKNAGSPNPCALLHLSNDCKNFEWRELQNALNLITTTSPSYPILACIEANINFLNSKLGAHEIVKLNRDILAFCKDLEKTDWQYYEAQNHDITKILIKKDGVDPLSLSNLLYEKFGIEDELVNQKSLLFLTGIGTNTKKFKKLFSALKKANVEHTEKVEPIELFQPYPFVKLKPKAAQKYSYTYVSKPDALLKLSGETIIPYPPSTAILYAGEAIQEWHLDYLPKDIKVLKK